MPASACAFCGVPVELGGAHPERPSRSRMDLDPVVERILRRHHEQTRSKP